MDRLRPMNYPLVALVNSTSSVDTDLVGIKLAQGIWRWNRVWLCWWPQASWNERLRYRHTYDDIYDCQNPQISSSMSTIIGVHYIHTYNVHLKIHKIGKLYLHIHIHIHIHMHIHIHIHIYVCARVFIYLLLCACLWEFVAIEVFLGGGSVCMGWHLRAAVRLLIWFWGIVLAIYWGLSLAIRTCAHTHPYAFTVDFITIVWLESLSTNLFW